MNGHQVSTIRHWNSPNPSITIPKARNVSYEDSIYTVYQIHLDDSGEPQIIEKRFSAFVQLRSMMPSQPAFEFPKTSFFENRFLPEVIERRRQGLEQYLNALLQNEICRNSHSLITFLLPFDRSRVAPTPVRGPTRTQSYLTTPENTPIPSGQFSLPLIPQGQRVVDSFVLPNGGVIMLAPILQEGCNALAYISTTYQELQRFPIEEGNEARIGYLAAVFESLNLVFASLQHQVGVISLILQHAEGKIDIDSILHFTAVLSAMEQGSQYVQRILNEFQSFSAMQIQLEQIGEEQRIVQSNSAIDLVKANSVVDVDITNYTPSAERNSTIDLAKANSPIDLGKVAKSSVGIDLTKNSSPLLEDEEINIVETKSEVVEPLSVSPSSIGLVKDSDNTIAYLDEEILKIRNQLDTLLIQGSDATDRKELTDITNSLCSVQATVSGLLEKSVDSASSGIIQDLNLLYKEIDQSKENLAVRKFERKKTPVASVAHMESFVFSMIQAVDDIDASNTKKAEELKENMKQCAKQLATLRQESNSISKHDNNRLEDLQENLSDLQHNFNKKFKTTNVEVKDKAYQKVIDMRVKQAQKHHQEIEEDMFGL